jgi:3-oxoadipate enol-lactonase
MPVADINGTSIAYEVTGEGPPLVLLHCWTGAKEFYFNQIMKFSSDYKCVSLDFPGHGASGEIPDKDYSVECFAEMTVELLGRLGVKKAVFAGHSLGGMVALYLGLHYPDMVEGLILLDTTSHLSGFIFQRMGALAAVVFGSIGAAVWNTGFHGTKAVVAGTAATHPLAGPVPRLFTAKVCSQGSNTALTRTLNKARNFNVTARLGEISAPAIIIVGNADLLADVRHAKRLADGLPNSMMLTVKGAGHMALFEKPKIVNDAIADFLARVYPPKPKAAKKKAAKKKAAGKKTPAKKKA